MGGKWLYNAPIVVFPPSHFSGGKTGYSSPSLKMACIFNLVALLNFTTTCQCHFWSTISVDGFTSQVGGKLAMGENGSITPA
jgi:hypothetical protein